MMAGSTQKTWRDVLRYAPGANRGTVRRYYEHYRREHGLRPRCDNLNCQFHNKALTWNGVDLPLILDHVNGVNGDNSPENLRYLCPNCDAQQKLTRGGANKGRVEQSPGGFAIRRADRTGLKDYTLPADPGIYRIS